VGSTTFAFSFVSLFVSKNGAMQNTISQNIKKWQMSRLFKKSKQIIRNNLNRITDCLTWDPWHSRSWSQEGEDMVLRRIFDKKKVGFYVDIGAHHPKHMSNTYYFYKRGWSGINIDAMPGSMTLFNKMRPRDMNLEIGVAQERDTLDFYLFNNSALNGFSRRISEERNDAKNSYKIKGTIQIDVVPLKEIFDQHLLTNNIDFMNVDVEGLDYEVLASNDWSRYRPKYVLAEILDGLIFDYEKSDIVKYMNNQGYELYGKQVYTVFFKDMSNASMVNK
jgi:FkbM family methyltransferase